ncbi:MAG: hypothetical protein NWQ28_03320 [Nodularia sp. (in: cyanobacteria)]|nr:hypothetical protein [Nodularia sp. (in: cyanobacteria)]
MKYNLRSLKPKTEKLLDKLKELKLQLQDLFLPKLILIDDEEILPGALLPKSSKCLLFNNRNITPILPLNHILLDFFTPEELTKQLKFELVDENDLSKVRLILDLPFSEIEHFEGYLLYKDYSIIEDNIIYEIPVLEVWPNFQAEGWTEYYGFYYDAEYGEETFQVSFPNVKAIQKFKDRKGDYQLVSWNEFPKFIECHNSQYNTIGIILLPTPETIDLLSFWKIGIDFRYDYTSVYVNKDNKVIESFNLENLHHKVTYVLLETRLPVLFEYFIPESFIPIDKPFPMSTVLTTRGSTDISQERPIFNGRIYIPARNRYEPEVSWVKKDFNWSSENLIYIRLFLKHLTLLLTANAVKNQVKEIQWCISYPPNFSHRDKYEYAQMWREITQELQAKTGVKHFSPNININDTKYFRSQNLALGQYFTDFEQHDLVNITCIDIGDTVSDISIWQDNQLIYQCSIHFGKKDLFSDFIKINPEILKIFDINECINESWINAPEYTFHDKLDIWLRLESANWLEKKRGLFLDNPHFQGLIRLMCIGLSGLYFYIGNVLSALHKEGKYTINEITPVYIGGIGSRLLHWFEEGGEFNRYSDINVLLSRMISKGSGFSDTEELTRISENPQDEVACGLVLNQTNLQELSIDETDYVICGEHCEINGKDFTSTSRLEFDGSINKFKVYNSSELSKFFTDFNIAVKELNIDTVKPVPKYRLNLEFESQQKLAKEIKYYLLAMNRGEMCTQSIFIVELKALLTILSLNWINN